MWASSRMGLRGFRVSLAQTATKEDCIEVQFSASEVIPCHRHAKHGTTWPSPPPRSEGRVTPLCGLYWDVPLDRIRFLVSAPIKHGIQFYAHLPQPGMVSTIDTPFRFSVLNMVRVSNPPSHPCTQTLIKSPPSYFPLSPPPPGSGSTLQSATKYLWPKLRNTVIPEQNAITLSARAVKKAT